MCDLSAIHTDVKGFFPKCSGKPDVLANDPAKEFSRIRDEQVKVDFFWVHDLFAAERQKTARQHSGPIGRLGYLLNIKVLRSVFLQVHFHHVAVADDHHENIVEIMSYPAGQFADCLHLLRLPELFLYMLSFGDVREYADVVGSTTMGIGERSDGEPFGVNLAIFALVPYLSTPTPMRQNFFPHRIVECLVLFS